MAGRPLAFTEYEFLSAIDAAFGFAVAAAMVVYSVFGAYVLTSHFAGKSFSKFVAISTSVLYSLFLTGPIIGIFLNVYQWDHLRSLYFLQFPDGELIRGTLSPEAALMAIVGPLFLGWLASLVYMHGYVRKPP